MPLTLEVVGQKAAQMGGAVRKVFQTGGTIGRLRENDWVLPDEYISGRHAKITFSNGSYLLDDTSTNGVFINSPQNRMVKGKPYALRDGDTIYIDDYEVRVTLAAESAAVPGYSSAENYGPSGGYSQGKSPLIPDDPMFDQAIGSSATPNETDPLALLGIQDARPFSAGPSAAGLASNSPMSDHYRPPAAPPPPPPPPQRSAPPAPQSGLIPDDYDPFAPDDAPAPRAPPRASPPPAALRPVAPPAPVSRTPDRPPPPDTDLYQITAVTSVISPQPRPAPPRPAAPPPELGAPPARPGVAPRGPAPPRSPPPMAQAPGPPIPPRPVPSPAAAPRVPSPAQAGVPPSIDASGSRRGLPGSGTDLDFAAMLAAAGVESARVTPELAAQFGQILRVVVSGLMDVLRARERIKDEFRMHMTTFKQADNNPLKFSANVEDALHNLLVKRNAAYLGPVEAFDDAFADLRNHQMAMLAGMRVAYESMLAEFDPARLQEDFEKQTKGSSFLSGSAKSKYWELYRNRFHDMVKDADTSFRNLFGDEFAKAYEDQLAKLKTLNRAERR